MARYNPLAPLTPAQQRKEALALLRAALLPGRQEVGRARTEARRVSQEAQAREEGLARAVAALSQNAGPATLAGYQSAAQTEGALAKGFSDAVRSGAEADAAAAAATLRRLGAPEAQVSQVTNVGQGAGDVTYGLGGAIPGTAWAREGAALAAAQNQLPATALGRGQQAVGQLRRKLTDRERELDQALEELEAKAPGLLAQIQRDIRGNEQAKVATGIQAEYLGLAGDKFGLDTRATVADITGVDPATGLPTVDVQVGAAKARGKRQEARQKALGQKNAAFRTARQDALGTARMLYKGETVPDPTTGGLTDKVVRPKWNEARQQLWTEIGPDLLRFGGGNAGRRAIRRQVFQMIDQALIAAGFQKPKKAKPVKAPPANRGPGNTRPG